jgi:energy-coupling factor transporter ATP-binding protein EcfA2
MLALEGISYRYAGALAPSLRDVSLELADGEVVGLVGAAEAGKTTLCLVASGLAPRAIGGTLTGRLLLDGVNVASRPMHEMAAVVGIAFANPAAQRSGVTATVYEEVAFGPMNLGLPRTEVIERTEAALAALGLDSLAPRHPARLSGGQQQLVAIAGLLALRPRHLILDEPTAQLDPAGTRLVAMAIAGLAAAGHSILVAEQKTVLLAATCRRVVAIDGGRIVLAGPAAEALRDPVLPTLGVAPPAGIRLGRAAEAAGVPAPARARLAEAISTLQAEEAWQPVQPDPSV